MAFRREETPRGLEITSLIDIVFLLLIFFLVSFAFSLGDNVSESKSYSELSLPKTETNLRVLHKDELQNLMIQIMSDTVENQISKRAYVLWPSYDDTMKITLYSAFKRSKEDSTFADFPGEFLSLPSGEFNQSQACTLIANSLNRYVTKEKLFKRNEKPIVEVRAEKSTEYKILNFILEQCSS